MSIDPSPLVPYNPAYADIYTDVERSIQQTIQAELIRRSWAYPIFTNRINEKDIGNVRAALGIMKISDIPDYTSGGGVTSTIRGTDGNAQPWPKWFNLLYQLRASAQNGVDIRNMDSIIRYVFPPRGGVLYLWDSVADHFTTSYCNYEYAGYINRDVPSQTLYDRITNIRFQVPSYAYPAVPETKITQIDVTDPALDFEVSVNSGS
jgi:hypothetical protein